MTPICSGEPTSAEEVSCIYDRRLEEAGIGRGADGFVSMAEGRGLLAVVDPERRRSYTVGQACTRDEACECVRVSPRSVLEKERKKTKYEAQGIRALQRNVAEVSRWLADKIALCTTPGDKGQMLVAYKEVCPLGRN